MKINAGQIAVVTGAASGIGYGLAEALGRRGLTVVISDVQAAALEKAQATLAAEGITALAVPTDVSDPAAVQALADTVFDRYGRVDLVCNNAGVVGRQAPAWEQSLETWHWLMDVAFFGVVHGVRSFAPILIQQGSGHFLNTASVGGLIPLPTLAPYNAAKHAVVGFTETLNVELRSVAETLGASVLCPGLVATALAQTSVLNRPDGAETPEPTATIQDEAAQHGSILTAAEVADLALQGVEDDRVHIITHPDNRASVTARVEGVLADLPARAS
jgi:NAD(P)-dependent dehydrogenase (short-subunit alcohol dehydrogenase family)